MPVFYELLPIIQAQLTSQNRDIQLGAAHALGGFAVAVTSSFCPADLRRTIAKGACDFVDSQVSTQFRDEEYHAPRFPSLIRAALSQGADRSISRPCWALSVISSLVVLSDGLVYTRPHFLRFVVNALAHTLVDKRADVRALDLQAWKCLIWAMMRLRCEGDRDESPTEIGTFDKVFVMLKQELRCGIGLSLVYCLAGDHPSPTEIGSSCASGGRSDLSRALEVICDMAKHTSTKLHTEGISLMAKMSNGIGTSSSDEGLPGRPWDIGRVLEGSLFDGVALGADNAKTALQLTSVLGLDDVRCLSEDEIAKHWDDILMIWNIGIRRAVQARKFLSFSVCLMQGVLFSSDLSYVLG